MYPDPKKGKRYVVQPGFSISTRRGLIRSGGYVFDNDFPKGNIEDILKRDGKPKLVEEPSEEPKVEYPEPVKAEQPKKKAAAKKSSKKKPVAKKAATKKEEPEVEAKVEDKEDPKPSFAFGRSKE